MAIRPSDLQQIVVKAADVARDASVPQQQLAAGQQVTAQQGKRHAELAETVQAFDEAGAAVIRERRRGPGGQWAGGDEGDDEQQRNIDEIEIEMVMEGKPLIPTKHGIPVPRVGRHVDVQA